MTPVNTIDPNVTPTNDQTTQAPASSPLLAKYATTPKRGSARKPPKQAHTLLAYAIEHGGRIDLTPTVKAELVSRGLPNHRIPNAIYDMQKYFGKTITSERVGRTVSAYTVSL